MKTIVLTKGQEAVLKEALALLAAEEAEAAARSEGRASLAPKKETAIDRRREKEIFFAV